MEITQHEPTMSFTGCLAVQVKFCGGEQLSEGSVIGAHCTISPAH